MKKTLAVLLPLLLMAAALHLWIGTSSVGFGGDKELFGRLLTEIRLPRLLTAVVLTAVAAGASMAIAGVLLQSFFRNPMADPFVLGIHSGAAFGAAAVTLIFHYGAVVLGGGVLMFGTTAAAFVGALTVTAAVSALSVRLKSNSALLVAGLMIGYGVNALISLMIFFSSPQEWENYFSWSFASFSAANLSQSLFLMVVCAVTLIYSIRIAKDLNLYRLSDDYAASSGVNVKRLRFGLVAVSSLPAAAVTAFCGPIAFVGIAAPRLIIDLFHIDDYRKLIPTAAVAGALLTLTADLTAKIPALFSSALPLNPVLSLFGLPFIFVALLGDRSGGRYD